MNAKELVSRKGGFVRQLRNYLPSPCPLAGLHRCAPPPHRSLPVVCPHKPLHTVLPQTGVHLPGRGAADSLTNTSSNEASTKATDRGVAVQWGTKYMASNTLAWMPGG